jgi:hypothetical protein
MSLPPALLPDSLPATREALQRVAVHVLARRRHDRTGRFGLRPSPGGLATPAFVGGEGDGGGEGLEVVRTCGRHLIVESGADTRTAELSTLGEAAALADVELTGDSADAFSVGSDTPPVGDPDKPLGIDDEAAQAIAQWFAFGSSSIDEVVATTPWVTASTTRQIWPEHFDLGGAVTLTGAGDGEGDVQANVGASPGDGVEPLPYLYVGPWTGDRPGDTDYWNAPFGAVLRAEDVVGLPPSEAHAAAVAFLRRGLDLLARVSPA